MVENNKKYVELIWAKNMIILKNVTKSLLKKLNLPFQALIYPSLSFR